ncbi:hypothetical protein niasHT_009859 [Heterodera trifolii]|uniref:Caspase family p20 domain-containing protein n=1 Tax=Heterodera trifolii TaxID=157864 RepID=A0ABD2LRF5_9BILA
MRANLEKENSTEGDELKAIGRWGETTGYGSSPRVIRRRLTDWRGPFGPPQSTACGARQTASSALRLAPLLAPSSHAPFCEIQIFKGMIENDSEDFRVVVCPDNVRSADVLLPIIQKHVAGSWLLVIVQLFGVNRTHSFGVLDKQKHQSSKGQRCSKTKVYPNFGKPRGLALIINNHDFGTHRRIGTNLDRDNLTALFCQMGYVTQNADNLTNDAKNAKICKRAAQKV